ncbi:MAG: GNAT family N-acetyltransferase [Ruegeria sp.]|uniref:GNAT family N-acetyltransferase n=1 Tax=Ruegeria sp. TaxID=1879320 RepID=UPI00349EC8FF
MVFVEEQGVPAEIEVDTFDEDALHLLAFLDDEPVGTARVLFDGEVAKIGRVCVLPEARGTGLGAALIGHGVEVASARGRVRRVMLGARVRAMGFYEKLGFRACGPVYDSAGIAHRDMIRDP